jgi:tyrosinase
MRTSVWKLKPNNPINLTEAWDPTIEWYARAIREMQRRPISNPTSWKYQAAIHEYQQGVPPNTEPVNTLPSPADRTRFWNQCQHSSWHFLSWHRIYLGYFEQIVASTIVGLGGPAGWSLPYWNYSDRSNPRALSLPPAFYRATLPDGSPNPLLITQRRPGANTGAAIGTPAAVDLSVCLSNPRFQGTPNGNPGFGGVRTPFNHGGGFPPGMVEATPHGAMHVRVGGNTGWMSGFNTAGLDPIFWLHHCNIDRLWEVWRKRNPAHTNPVDPAFLGLIFPFHDATGAIVTGNAGQWLDPATCPLPYSYDDVSDPLAGVGPAGAAVAVAAGAGAMSNNPAEMVGATSAAIELGAGRTDVRMDVVQPTGPAAARVGVAPQEMYINIENITGVEPNTYEVYVNVPAGDDPRSHPELYAGLLPMFGLAEASRGDNNRPADGLHYALDIGPIAQRLQDQGRWNPAELRVSFVPEPEPEGGAAPAAGAAIAPVAPIRVGRVSLYVS